MSDPAIRRLIGTPMSRAIQTIGMPSGGQRSLRSSDSLNSGSFRQLTRKLRLGARKNKGRRLRGSHLDALHHGGHLNCIDRHPEDAVDFPRKVVGDRRGEFQIESCDRTPGTVVDRLARMNPPTRGGDCVAERATTLAMPCNPPPL